MSFLRAAKALVAVSGALAIGGCASIFGPDTPSLGGKFLGCWDRAKVEADDQRYEDFDKKLDDLLSCYLGPDKAAVGNSPNEEAMKKVRLLRAHIAATLIARYGTFNVTGEVGGIFNIRFRGYSNLQADAEDIMTGIHKVENEIRSESDLFENLTPRVRPPKFFAEVNKVYERAYRYERYVELTDLLKEAGTPTVRRGQQIITNIIATASAPTPGGIITALKDVKTVIKKIGVIEIYGGAYLEDAKNYLTCVYLREAGQPRRTYNACGQALKEDWKNWDKSLEEACERLGKASGLSKAICVPGQYR